VGTVADEEVAVLHSVETWLGTIPPLAVYALVLLVIGIESMGVPLPGEVALISAALLAAAGALTPEGVAISASLGAIIGDSFGYLIGRRGGRALLERLGKRFPRHLGPAQLNRAEASFRKHGIWAVFFGRFVALLRILAGPIAGSLRMPYLKFFAANATGGVVWATSTTLVIYFLGKVAEQWLSSLSWVLLAVTVVGGLVITALLRRRAHRMITADPEPAREDHEISV
jgi:membrane protein DedA with SNARE-associated domain